MRRILGWVGILVLMAGMAWGQECVTGNVSNTLGFAPDFVSGQMEFAYLIHPLEQDCCEEGYSPFNVTFHLQVASDELFGGGVVTGVYAAEGDDGNWVPAQEIWA
jgi:hypothetical protein